MLDPYGIERDLGSERARCMWPYRSYLDAGVKFSFGTDSPVVNINSREAIYDAVRTYTLGRGDEVGSLEVGKLGRPRRTRAPAHLRPNTFAPNTRIRSL